MIEPSHSASIGTFSGNITLFGPLLRVHLSKCELVTGSCDARMSSFKGTSKVQQTQVKALHMKSDF